MKTVLIFTLFLAFACATFAQDPWEGFPEEDENSRADSTSEKPNAER